MRKKLTDYFEISEDGTLVGMTVPIRKAAGWSSFDVVKKLRHVTRIRKVGHAGTLDPFATGLLIVGFGRHTRMLDIMKDEEKEYRLKLRFGLETDTYDITGSVISERECPAFSMDTLEEVLKSFQGEFDQLPPVYSARKVDGKPLYRYARAGKPVEVKSKKVFVRDIRVLDYTHPDLELLVHCGPGTYMRSIAHDLGEMLSCGGCAVELSRTAIGAIKLEDAFTVEEFEDEWKSSAA